MVLVPPEIPANIRTCQDFPNTVGVRTQGDLAETLLRGFQAHRDCQENLRAIDRILRNMETPNEN